MKPRPADFVRLALSVGATIAIDFLIDPNQTPDSCCLTEVKPAFAIE